MLSWEDHQGYLNPRSIKMAFSQSIHGEGQEKKIFFKLLTERHVIWFRSIFPTKGNPACPRKHIYLEFLKDTELRQRQNKGFR